MSMKVMVNGFPGNMAREIAAVVLERGYELVPFSLTGEAIEENVCEFDGRRISLLKPSNRDAAIEAVKSEYPDMISVDFTHPTAVNSNSEFYVAHKLPFVMGTTGGDRDKLLELVEKSGLYAVIAPNMAKQIVALQSMLENMARDYPGVFNGYDLNVVESHQSTKADTSGTAKAIVGSFKKMGMDFDVEQIEKVREPDEQLARMNVPEEFLKGHAFHTYTLTSGDGSVNFQFQHNVCGRRVYAEGTVDAVEFLERQISDNAKQTYYTMIDVLKAGAMK